MLGMETQEMKLVCFKRFLVHGKPVAIIRPITMKRKVLERFNWERTVDATERFIRVSSKEKMMNLRG